MEVSVAPIPFKAVLAKNGYKNRSKKLRFGQQPLEGEPWPVKHRLQNRFARRLKRTRQSGSRRQKTLFQTEVRYHVRPVLATAFW
jgi:hypothetical protein